MRRIAGITIDEIKSVKMSWKFCQTLHSLKCVFDGCGWWRWMVMAQIANETIENEPFAREDAISIPILRTTRLEMNMRECTPPNYGNRQDQVAFTWW